MLIENLSQLTNAGVAATVSKTAPSITPSTTTISTLAELDASKLQFTQNPEPQAVPAPNSPEVWSQSVCTDHMITCQWTSAAGWDSPHLKPYGPFSIMPTASVLHYATECFEGTKLYRGYDGKLRLFRPSCNCNRMLTSATRIALPAFDPRELEKLIIALVARDGAKWLPSSRPGTFLYLRPTMIGTAPALGVQKPKEATLFIIAAVFPSFDGPAGTLATDPTYTASLPAESTKPGLKLLASSESTVRAWPGGFGYAKVGANYGPSLMAQAEARERGYDQILWLFGSDAEVTEAGASNFFVVWKTRDGKTH